MLKKFGFWISISFLMLAVISFILFLTVKKKDFYADEVIEQVSDLFKKDLKSFLKTVEGSVDTIQKNARSVDVDMINKDRLNNYFSGLIDSEPYLKGVVVLGENMNFFIYKDENSWVTTHNSITDSLLQWSRLNTKLEEIGGWMDTYNSFMYPEDFETIKNIVLSEGEHVWRTANSNVDINRDLIFNIFRLGITGSDDLVAFMYRTGELDERFRNVLSFENPLVSILTTRDSIVTPMRTDDTAKIAVYDQLTTEVKSVFNNWMTMNPDSAFTYSIATLNTEFWLRIDTLTPTLGARGFGVTISKNDLIAKKRKVDEAYLYLAILLLIFAVAAFLPLYRKKQKKKSVPISKLKSLSDDEILSMINKGESELVEFKSSLRWDFREEKVNKILEDVILKSISAFANAKGGTLFIGVTDEQKIIGLEHDFKTLKKQDVDYFELHLRKLINNEFSLRFSNKYILMEFLEIESKIICVIYLSAGDSPLYLKIKNKQGHEVERFFVRSGNASQEITSLKEINEYIKSRFKIE